MDANKHVRCIVYKKVYMYVYYLVISGRHLRHVLFKKWKMMTTSFTNWCKDN